MKKIICIVTVLTIAAFALTACGDSGKDNNSTTAAPETTTAAAEQTTDTPAAETDNTQAALGRFTFTFKGTAINVKDDAAPILEALGECKKYTEETSCAFDGLDKSYTYTSFVMTTYPDGDNERVNSLSLLDDTVSTADGICIGDSQDKVEEVYGADSFNGVNAYILTEGEAQLTIIIESGKVSSIQYVALFE